MDYEIFIYTMVLMAFSAGLGFAFGVFFGYKASFKNKDLYIDKKYTENEIDKSIAKEDTRIKKELKETAEFVESLKPYKKEKEYYIEKPYNSVRDILEDNPDE